MSKQGLSPFIRRESLDGSSQLSRSDSPILGLDCPSYLLDEGGRSSTPPRDIERSGSSRKLSHKKGTGDTKGKPHVAHTGKVRSAEDVVGDGGASARKRGTVQRHSSRVPSGLFSTINASDRNSYSHSDDSLSARSFDERSPNAFTSAISKPMVSNQKKVISSEGMYSRETFLSGLHGNRSRNDVYNWLLQEYSSFGDDKDMQQDFYAHVLAHLHDLAKREEEFSGQSRQLPSSDDPHSRPNLLRDVSCPSSGDEADEYEDEGHATDCDGIDDGIDSMSFANDFLENGAGDKLDKDADFGEIFELDVDVDNSSEAQENGEIKRARKEEKDIFELELGLGNFSKGRKRGEINRARKEEQKFVLEALASYVFEHFGYAGFMSSFTISPHSDEVSALMDDCHQEKLLEEEPSNNFPLIKDEYKIVFDRLFVFEQEILRQFIRIDIKNATKEKVAERCKMFNVVMKFLSSHYARDVKRSFAKIAKDPKGNAYVKFQHYLDDEKFRLLLNQPSLKAVHDKWIEDPSTMCLLLLKRTEL